VSRSCWRATTSSGSLSAAEPVDATRFIPVTSAPAPSTDPVVIRCDAGRQVGIGHVMRCVALAEEIAARGRPVVFVADLDAVDWARDQVLGRGFAHRAPAAGADGEVSMLTALRPAYVVIDSYLLPVAVYDGLRAAGIRVLALVDGDPQGRAADLLVDQNIGAELDVWELAAGLDRVGGLDYALMRDEILDRRPDRPREESSDPPRVFAFFGGTDAFGAGPVLADALIATGQPFALRIVAPQPWAVPPVPGDHQSIELIAPTDQLATEVLAADLVISAAGTSSWELLCLGAACAFVCVADNQELSYGRAVSEGLGLGLGRLDAVAADSGPAADLLRGALSDPGLRSELRARAWQRVDGRGRGRVLDAFGRVTG
jgi:spore coat polysaccharide biosynthesis predicted glycosyltransferase SpsG